MRQYTTEEIQQRIKNRVKEWKETIPGLRETILEELIERELYSRALSYNSALDADERQKEWEEQQKHSNVAKCVCAKIRELFK